MSYYESKEYGVMCYIQIVVLYTKTFLYSKSYSLRGKIRHIIIFIIGHIKIVMTFFKIHWNLGHSVSECPIKSV